MLRYQEVAKHAAQWAYDPRLTLPMRRVAKNLADLAGILTNPDYGCAAEHEAAEVMYKHLSQASVLAGTHGSDKVPPGFVNVAPPELFGLNDTMNRA